MDRSILDLSPEELREIQETNKFPEGVSLIGIEERKDFDVLYRYRNNPKVLVGHLLKGDKQLEQDRINLKKAELKLREEKVKGQTYLLKDLKTHLTRIETKVDLLIQEWANKNKEE